MQRRDDAAAEQAHNWPVLRCWPGGTVRSASSICGRAGVPAESRGTKLFLARFIHLPPGTSRSTAPTALLHVAAGARGHSLDTPITAPAAPRALGSAAESPCMPDCVRHGWKQAGAATQHTSGRNRMVESRAVVSEAVALMIQTVTRHDVPRPVWAQDVVRASHPFRCRRTASRLQS